MREYGDKGEGEDITTERQAHSLAASQSAKRTNEQTNKQTNKRTDGLKSAWLTNR